MMSEGRLLSEIDCAGHEFMAIDTQMYIVTQLTIHRSSV